MGTLRDLGQKIKGKTQQFKGDANQERGQGVKGGFQKLKGKVNETVADTKLNSRRNDDVRDDGSEW
jgi:hypothetical protein